MPEPTDADRLKALEARIAAAKAKEDAPEIPHQEEHHSQAQLAWRMVMELVAGLLIGFGMGYGLDLLLGTGPWLMIVFIFLGFAAGVKSMIASAGQVTKRTAAEAAEQEDERDG